MDFSAGPDSAFGNFTVPSTNRQLLLPFEDDSTPAHRDAAPLIPDS